MLNTVEVTVTVAGKPYTCRAEYDPALLNASHGQLSIASALQGSCNVALLGAARLIASDDPEGGRCPEHYTIFDQMGHMQCQCCRKHIGLGEK